MASILAPTPPQAHLNDSEQERLRQREIQYYSGQQQQLHPGFNYLIPNRPALKATTSFSNREMLAAQQHFGYPMQQQQQQQQQQRDGQTGDSTPSGGWNDDSEFFLRNLLANSVASPHTSSISGGSGIGSSPSYIEDNRNSLSPTSSTGFQSLHDFIHTGGSANFATPLMSDGNGSNYIAPDQMNSKASMLLQQQMQQHQQVFGNQDQAPVDANALNFFVNSMVNGPDRQLMQPQGASLDPSLVSPMYNMAPSSFGFQPQMFLQQQSLGVPQQEQHQQPNYSQYQAMLEQSQQTQMPQQHPALDARKRSAPSTVTNDNKNASNKGNAPTARNIKKMKTQSPTVQNPPPNATPAWKVTTPTTSSQYPGSSALPRMEVGSNATALAAIERLKAKRKAEFEQKIKQEESNALRAANESPKGSERSGDSSHGSGEPVQRNQKKVAHNAIERRYRNNINDRITALRNAVPALRELRPKKPGSSRKGKGAQEQDLVDGVPAATKLNKATILGKATEYIRYLKGRETRLVSEVAGLRELIRSLEGGEELLDLWEGEMENVVAEQEAKAKAAFALEDDSYDMEDDDEEDEEEDEDDSKPSSRSPSGSSSSSRYMMGVFMGFSVLGGGAELMSDHQAATSTQAENVVRASSGRVIGASHQLLKRGMNVSKLKIGRMVDVPHHYDHIPSHLLAAEVLRGLALLACVAFIFWPLISHLIKSKSMKDAKGSDLKKRGSLKQKRKEMLGALARSRPRPHEMDLSMRKFVGAPINTFQSGLALASTVMHELLCRLRLTLREPINAEQAAVWCRLLELETSLGPLAHRSLLARLHTLLTVGTLPNIGNESKSDSAVMVPARVYGTMAIAMVRAARGHSLMISLAERRWNMAKRCRLLVEEEEEEDTPDQDRWIDNVLDRSLSEAIALCPSPTLVAATFAPKVDSNTRASLLAPLPSIAAIQHSKQLTSVWEILLSQIVQDTCPTSADESLPTLSDFMKHHSEVKLFLSLLSSQTDQDRLSAQISRLTTTAPKYDCWQTLSIVTFGTWALLLGNISVARSVAAALLSAKDVSELPTCAVALIRLIFDGSEEIISALPKGSIEAVNEVDALAAAALHWLLLLRRISSTIHGQRDYSEEVVEKAIVIRRLLATARMARNSNDETLLLSTAIIASNGLQSSDDYLSSHRDSLASTMTTQSKDDESTGSMLLSEDGTITTNLLSGNEARLDESLDTLTDILAVLGKKAALGSLRGWKSREEESEKHDSGVEWGL